MNRPRSRDGHYLALCGGVGGAKLALGLSRILEPGDLTIVTNTGDDFDHLGLRICPDLDTVMYTLAGLANREQGWGLADESWQFLDALQQLGGETWFRLGDRDLATHILRSRWLAEGLSLSTITRRLSGRLGIEHTLVPMSDDKVSTHVCLQAGGTLSFQHYFVRDRCEPAVTGFIFEGVEQARPAPDFLAALEDSQLAGILICPSNPFVSIDPMLALPGIRERLATVDAPVIAVSPIVGGQAIKGPTAKMMAELDMPGSAAAVAAHYGDLLDGFIIDQVDQELVASIAASGVTTISAATVMVSLQDRIQLAEESLKFLHALAAS